MEAFFVSVSLCSHACILWARQEKKCDLRWSIFQENLSFLQLEKKYCRLSWGMIWWSHLLFVLLSGLTACVKSGCLVDEVSKTNVRWYVLRLIFTIPRLCYMIVYLYVCDSLHDSVYITLVFNQDESAPALPSIGWSNKRRYCSSHENQTQHKLEERNLFSFYDGPFRTIIYRKLAHESWREYNQFLSSVT